MAFEIISKLEDICVSSAPVVGSLKTGGDLCSSIYVSLKASLISEIGVEGSRCDLIRRTFLRVAEITVEVHSTVLEVLSMIPLVRSEEHNGNSLQGCQILRNLVLSRQGC